MSAALDAIRERALLLGFARVGFARADEPIDVDFARYEAFLASGKAAAMGYLSEDREARLRLDGDAILAGAKSVVCVADSCAGPHDAVGVARSIARYARGRDYHNHLRRRLRKLASFIRRIAPGSEARPMTDTAPVLERAWAVRAGLGFIGKNGMLIAPGAGSHVLLGEVVTTLDLVPDEPLAERCGLCTRCLDACPTSAFEAPFVLDARLCLSYLTVELRGAMPEPLRSSVGDRLFGCDTCQDVCPHNAALEKGQAAYAPLDRWKETSIEAIAEVDRAGHARLVSGSAVTRARHEGLVRNAVTVLANRCDPALRPLFERLAERRGQPSVREHAIGALRRLGLG
jgi:epoxyqueuosine reductase